HLYCRKPAQTNPNYNGVVILSEVEGPAFVPRDATTNAIAAKKTTLRISLSRHPKRSSNE
ncbi:MAG: hypothetical protein ABSF72_18855, partial [Candidatus Sulfotelmatobacter sp.]